MADLEYVWKERKRTLFGLPLSFTTYKLTNEKLFVCSGILHRREEETRLYRIMDLTLNRSLEERIFGIGTIRCFTADKSTPEFNIARIKNSKKIRHMLSDMVEKERLNKRIVGREFMTPDVNGEF